MRSFNTGESSLYRGSPSWRGRLPVYQTSPGTSSHLCCRSTSISRSFAPTYSSNLRTKPCRLVQRPELLDDLHMNGSVIWKQRLDDLIGGLSSRNAYVDEEILGNGDLCDVRWRAGRVRWSTSSPTTGRYKGSTARPSVQGIADSLALNIDIIRPEQQRCPSRPGRSDRRKRGGFTKRKV